MPVSVAQSWKHLFSPAARRKGRTYFEEGRVRLLESATGDLEAEVRGTVPYFTLVGVDEEDLDGEELYLECSCPAFEKFGPCKHLWAVLLTVEAGLEEVVAAPMEEILGFEPLASGEAAATEEWARRLTEMSRNAPATPAPGADLVAADPPQLVYALDLFRTRRDGCLVLELMLRRRRKDGSWGVPRTPGGEPEDLDAAATGPDATILFKLRGAATPEDYYGWSPYRRESVYCLEGRGAEELLPLLSETGRLFWRGSQRKLEGEPVRWDGGEPWRFEASLKETGDDVSLVGELRRGEERRALEEPLVVLNDGLVGFETHIARLDARGGLTLIAQLRARGPLHARAADRERFEFALRCFPGGLWRCVPELEPPEEEAPTPRLHIHGDTRGRRTKRLSCDASFDYGGTTVAAGDADDTREVLLTSDRRVLRRDPEAEREAIRTLAEAGLLLSGPRAPELGTVPLGEMPRLVRELLGRGWTVLAPDGALRTAGGSSVSVRSGVDWFELEGGLAFGDQVAPFPELLAAAREGRDTVRLGDGSVGLLPEDWAARWSLLELGEKTATGVRFQKRQGWMLDALLAERDGVHFDVDFDRYRAGLGKFGGLKPRKEPASFRGTLRDYQREGLGRFKFWADLGLGGCLADDMGLGKTVQVLALLEARRRAGSRASRRPSLVVAPRSVLFNWVDEAARFTPRLRVLDYTGLRRRELRDELDEADLVLTTYGTLRRDAAELAEREFEYVILDEAQAIKNASSQTAKAARLLRAENRLALSGTPVENHLGELWSLFEFLNPGMLGRSGKFQALFEEASPDGDRLAEAMRPFFLRRTKAEVLDDLPEKTEQVLHCDLGKKERRRYDELRAYYRDELLGRADDVGLNRMKIHVLEALLRLRQSACHPGLVDPDSRGESSAKLEALLPRLEETASEGHKALVFSQFTKLLAIVRDELDARGLTYEYLDGRTRKRKERVERFQTDPDCPLFLISLKAGGQGLNLTAADNVFLLDPWWNPAVEAQAIDRAHRIGQRKPVFAYRMIARDTVEERVLELQERKRALAEALFAGKGGALRDLTREDLERLLT